MKLADKIEKLKFIQISSNLQVSISHGVLLSYFAEFYMVCICVTYLDVSIRFDREGKTQALIVQQYSSMWA